MGGIVVVACWLLNVPATCLVGGVKGGREREREGGGGGLVGGDRQT